MLKQFVIAASVTLITAVAAMAQSASEEFVVGLWHRPTVDSGAREALWEHCEQAGVTDLFVQTFYHGFTIYPSNEERTFEQRSEFVGRDVLQEYIEEAHARGIRVHAWLDTLLWGPDYEAQPDIPRNRFAEEHPEYRVTDAQGNTTRQFFVTPANSEVLNLVSLLCIEICHQHPDLDGIHLDQVRYPGGGDFTYDWAALSKFQEEHGDPRTDQSAQTQSAWREFTESQLTAMVQQIALLVRGLYHGNVVISAAVHPFGSQALETDLKRQAWNEWLGDDEADAVVPMCFANSAEKVSAQARGAVEVVRGAQAACWIGLAYWPGGERASLADQLVEVPNLPAGGVAFFNHSWLAEEPSTFSQIGEWVSARSVSPE